MTPPPGAEFVGAGSFRVDRQRALKKLMHFQLADARMHPLPWIQAAVASGAQNIFVGSTPAGFEIAFQTRLAQRVDEGYE